MKAMVTVIAAICCTGAALAALTSRSYVQDGLVAQYDGIDNAGYGIHSDSTNIWVDLTGNGNDGTVNSAVTWGAKGWQNSNASIQPVTVGKGLAAGIAATGVMSAQMTFTPLDGSRMYLFAQKDGNSKEFGVGRTLEDNANAHNQVEFYAVRPYWKRVYSENPTRIRVLGGEWAPITVSVSAGDYPFYFTVHNGADPDLVVSSVSNRVARDEVSTAAFAFSANATSVIGCDYADPTMAFCGTYNAFRLYNRDLTEEEIKLNAAIDAVRFNGGDPTDYAILANYTFDDEGRLCAAFTATAETGGKIRVAGEADAAGATLPVSVGMAAMFTAVPDSGYVFQEWTGDVAAITSGSFITPTISVKSASDGAVQAVFRRRGTALDGMVFDLDMQDLNNDGVIDASDRIGNAMKVSAADATAAYVKAWSTTDNETFSAYGPNFSVLDVAAPMMPFTTNSQTCLYFPQHVDGDTAFNSRVDLANDGIMGEVATFFVRFKWEGAVVAAKNCNIALLMNGCSDGYWNNKKGFGLTIRTMANYPDIGYLNVTVPQSRTGAWNDAVSVTSGSWVDCFVSVYPSPTDPNKSNADVWICETPAFSGGVFGKPVIKGCHFDDGSALPRMLVAASTYGGLRFGNERKDVNTDSTGAAHSMAFRGAIAAVKGWRRILTTNEMWCVMAGLHGGVFHVGVTDGKADEFGVSGTEATFDPTAMAWQKMKKSLTATDRTLTLSVPLTAENRGLSKLLTIKPLFDGVGATCPVAVTANGVNVGTFDLVDETERTILLRGGAASCNADGRLVISIVRPAGCAGTLSFDALSLAGSWQIGNKDDSKAEMKEEGKGVPQVAVMGDPIYKHVQRSLTKVCPSLSFFFDVPESVNERCTWLYSTKFIDPRAGYEQPMHIEVNGSMVWTNGNVVGGTEVDLQIDPSLLMPGLNELKLCYDTPNPNWISIDWHRLRLVPPSAGLALSVR